MNWKKILLALVLVDFAALTGWTLYTYGPVGWIAPMFDNAATMTVTADLVIALSMVLVWMVRDARRRGVSPAPFVVVTLLTGSIGPLLYLLTRPSEEPSHAPA